MKKEATKMAKDWVMKNNPMAGLAAGGIDAGKKMLQGGMDAVKGVFK